MRAAVYVVVWSSIVVALVLDDQTGARMPDLAPLIAVAVAITILDLATYHERKDRNIVDPARALTEMADKLKSGEASDGYHTHNELYEYRTLYHAHAARAWALDGLEVTKSWRHADGGLCFGGGWFIVTAQLPTGQVSNHYPERDWPLFDVPEVERPAEWDGHTPQEAAERLRAALSGGTA